jgi:hypothetical protein
VIYSQWRPTGGYDYFETNEVAPLGNDLPTPQLREVAGIGAPSVEAGRVIPSGARHVGSGPDARGVIAPMSGQRGTLGAVTSMSPALAFAAGAAAVGAIWLIDRKWK